MKTKKGKRAVLVRLAIQQDSVRLNLDDLEEFHTQGSGAWQQRESITFKDFDLQKFDQLSFDEQELADFGYYVLARLHAFKSMGEI